MPTSSASPAVQGSIQASFEKAKKKGKRTQKTLHIAEKKQLIHEAETSGLTMESLASKWGIGRKTAYRIMKDKEKIKASINDHGKRLIGGARSSKPTLEKELLEWMETVRSKRIQLNINRLAVAIAAERIRKRLLKGSSISDEERKELSAWSNPSEGWVKRFVKRHKLPSVVLHGSAGDVDLTDPELIAEIQKIKDKLDEYAVGPATEIMGLFPDAPAELHRALTRVKQLLATPALGRASEKRKQTAVYSFFSKRDRRSEAVAAAAGKGDSD